MLTASRWGILTGAHGVEQPSLTCHCKLCGHLVELAQCVGSLAWHEKPSYVKGLQVQGASKVPVGLTWQLTV